MLLINLGIFHDIQFGVLVSMAQSRGYITLNQANNVNAAVQNVSEWLLAYGNTVSNWLIQNHFY